MKILLGIFIFSFIVIFHELGHFLFAKLSGITVTEFSLGIGPRLLSHQWGETRYSWKLIPFGGSCMMLGEEEEISNEHSFQNKSVWKRILVVAGGPLFNFLLAFIIAIILIGNIGYDAPVLLSVPENSVAAKQGLQKGDEILEINGKTIHFGREASNYQFFHKGKAMVIKYKRNNNIAYITLPEEELENTYSGINGNSSYRVKTETVQTLKYSYYEVKYWIETTLSSLKMIVTGKTDMNNVSGPVGVVKSVGKTYEAVKSSGMYYILMNMLNIVLFLSVNLGVLNLIPFPALDGGRLVFLVLEAIRGKRVNPMVENVITVGGIFVLLIFMVVVTGNDIRQLF